jgi:hypothetical protein
MIGPLANVRFRSKADVTLLNFDVRFTPRKRTLAVMITSHISMVRDDKRQSRALCEAIVANLIFGAQLAWRCL